MRYLIYARVSPKGSDYTGGETSCPSQIAAVRAYILAREPEAQILTATDELKSGKDITGRPAFRQIVADLHAGNAPWDVFAVWRLDRAFRSTADAAPYFRELLRQGKGFLSATERLDLSTPAGRAMLAMLQVFAEFERESGSQRTKLKMESIAARGEWPVGHPPIGYRRTAPHCNILAVDDEKAPIVQELFRAYATGDTGATNLARALGMKCRQSALHILRNRTYLGRIVYAGQEYPGKHPALIEQELFDQVQTILPKTNSSPRVTRQKYPYLCAGLVKCHCGRNMTSSTAGGNGGRYHYYRCTDADCDARVRADALDLAVLNLMSGITLTEADIDYLVEELHRQRDAQIRAVAPETKQLTAAIRAKAREKAKIMDAFLSGLVTQENKGEWNQRLADCSAALETLKARQQALTAATPPPINQWEAAEYIIRQMKTIAETVKAQAGNPDNLRPLVLSAVESITHAPTGWFVTLYGEKPALVSTESKLAHQSRTVLTVPLQVREPGRRAA